MSVRRRMPSGRIAEWAPDPFREHAYVLSIDGSEQSHVDTADPGDLALEYVRRVGYALDAFAMPGAPLRVLHLGGGALTLVRYLAVTRPGSQQWVVEAEDGLLDFVTECAPLPEGTRLTTIVGDARTSVPRGEEFDVVVVDVYLGTEVPASLLETGFIDAVADATTADGIVVVNVADDAGLARARRWRALFDERFTATALVAHEDVLAGRGAGNVLLLASAGDGLVLIIEALLRHGPHPAAADA